MQCRGITKPAPQAEREGTIAERVENKVAAHLLAQGEQIVRES